MTCRFKKDFLTGLVVTYVIAFAVLLIELYY